jgi:protoporphyrinogen oxidase
MNHASTVVIGAGPAGLTAGYELTRIGASPLVLERGNQVGGIARTEMYKGNLFDIGGHRFFTRHPDIQDLWETMLGPDFLLVPRLSRIHYQGRFFKYPVDAIDAIAKLGPTEGLRIALSYIRAHLWPSPSESNLEQWMVNRFGRRLFEIFFKSYTEKVWGMTCDQIGADWAAQRIQGLSLWVTLRHALFGQTGAKSLIGEFHYPARGPGMMWQRFREAIEEVGGSVRLGAEATRLYHDGQRVSGVEVRSANGAHIVSTDHVISSMCLQDLITQLDPPPPEGVLYAANRLRYRSLILVGLIVNRAGLFPDQWLYIHSPDLRVGRIQNLANWSAAMVRAPATTSLGMEYFCTEGDAFWQRPDSALIDLASQELSSLELIDDGDVVDGVVYRQPAAYPVYDLGYQHHLGTIRGFLSTLENLQTVGRNGMHRYNNQDHSMLTASLAVRNWAGEDHNLWAVNTDPSHNEGIAER